MRFFVSVAQDGSLNADDHYFTIDRYLKSFGRDSRGKDLVNLFSLGRIKESISVSEACAHRKRYRAALGKEIPRRTEIGHCAFCGCAGLYSSCGLSGF
jgi:hypothetical protein